MILRFVETVSEDIESLVEIRIAAMRESLQKIGRFDPARARLRLINRFVFVRSEEGDNHYRRDCENAVPGSVSRTKPEPLSAIPKKR